LVVIRAEVILPILWLLAFENGVDGWGHIESKKKKSKINFHPRAILVLRSLFIKHILVSVV